jgi:hypothetical protein
MLRITHAPTRKMYASPQIIMVIKSRKMRWAGHIARMGYMINAYKILVAKRERKRPLGRPIRTGIWEKGWEDVDWIDLAWDRGQCQALVNMVMNLRVP